MIKFYICFNLYIKIKKIKILISVIFLFAKIRIFGSNALYERD